LGRYIGQQRPQLIPGHNDIVGAEDKPKLVLTALGVEKLAPGKHKGLFQEYYLQAGAAVAAASG
jgi:hypothetical protein